MDNRAKEKFLEIKELFWRLSQEMCTLVESYYIWRALAFARSIPEVGQEQADKTAKLMNSYKDFFMATEYSHLQTFVIGLMKFFDKYPQALSFAGLVREIEKNKKIFTLDLIKTIYPERKIDHDNYEPIDQETMSHVEQLSVKYKSIIKSLKDVRDKQFAHTDIRPIKGTFVPNEVESFIEAVQETFNKLSIRFDSSSTIWNHLKDDSIASTRFLLENLEKGDNQYREEILKKYRVE